MSFFELMGCVADDVQVPGQQMTSLLRGLCKKGTNEPDLQKGPFPVK